MPRKSRPVNLRDASLTHAAWTVQVRAALERSGRTVTPAARGDGYHLTVDGRPVRVVTDSWVESRGTIALELSGNFEGGQAGIALQPTEWWVYVNTVAATAFLFHLPTARRVLAAMPSPPASLIWAEGREDARAFHTVSLRVNLASLQAAMPPKTWTVFDLDDGGQPPQPSLL